MANNGANYYQPGIVNYDKTKLVPDREFAFETLDPPYKSALPSYIAYKWADALLAVAPSPRSTQSPDFGYIHRPSSMRSDWYDPGTNPRFLIDAVQPRFRVVATDVPNYEGELVNKVGWRTGWTQGAVILTCTDYSFGASAPRRTFRCSVRTSVPVWPGDSGGPLFRILPGDGTYVELIGVASTSNRTTQTSVFSRWDGIQAELGTLTAVP